MADNVHTEIADEAGAPHGPEPTAFGLDAPGWVALAMLTVFLLLLWKKVPAAIGGALDRKIAAIRQQLDEAAELRREAEVLKAEYEVKSAQADEETAVIISRARAEADALRKQADVDAAALVERRSRMAEAKIEAAERAAVDEVRSRAASIAATAAERIIRERLEPAADRELVDRAIADLASS